MEKVILDEVKKLAEEWNELRRQLVEAGGY